MHVVKGALLAVLALFGAAWTLPQTSEVKDNGPRTYRFTVDYKSLSPVGDVVHFQHVVGDYTRGLPHGEMTWKNVMLATAIGPGAALGPAVARGFMNGLTYRADMPAETGPMSAVFFKDFPPDAVVERNLVWDTLMFEAFGQRYFRNLKLNEPYHAMQAQDLAMPGVGTFQNRDVELTWIGKSRRNGQDCAVIDYTALMNPLNISNAGVKMTARSHYWGQIWVALATRQVEYATLYEVVTGELTLPGAAGPQPLSVLRTGVFEPLGSAR